MSLDRPTRRQLLTTLLAALLGLFGPRPARAGGRTRKATATPGGVPPLGACRLDSAGTAFFSGSGQSVAFAPVEGVKPSLGTSYMTGQVGRWTYSV